MCMISFLCIFVNVDESPQTIRCVCDGERVCECMCVCVCVRVLVATYRRINRPAGPKRGVKFSHCSDL